MQRSFALIRLSPLSSIPVLWLATQASVNVLVGRGTESYQDLGMIVCTTLGWLGCAGLLLGGFRSTYEKTVRRLCATILIASGFLSVFILVGMISYVSWVGRGEPALPEDAGRGFWAVAMLFALLAWPIAAGVHVLIAMNLRSLSEGSEPMS